MSKRHPNVVIVMADEWRGQAFGYTGDPNAHTPTIDRFAAESMCFSQAVSGTPVCGPARASFLTGQYSLTNGVYINDVPLSPQGTTLGEAFAKAGYRTGYIGKWHLYGSPDGRYGRRAAYIPADKRFGFSYWKAAECSHDYNRSFYYAGDDATMRYWDGYDAIAQTADACDFMRDNANAEQPFCLFLSFGPPHFPLKTAPEAYQEMYRSRELVLRPNVPLGDADEAQDDLRGYYAHIAALDDCFARLLTGLRAADIYDDTVVVFTSDHGDMMGSQGMVARQKLYPWEESIRVPLLFRYPAIFGTAGSQSMAPINSADIMPSLLGLCGLEIPSTVQGVNYFDRNVPSSVPTTSAFLSMAVPVMSALTHGIAEYRGVRDAQYTYVRSISGPWLLYDNIADPYQMHNLVSSPDAHGPRVKLERELDRWLDAVGDEFLPASEYLCRDGLLHYEETKKPIGYMRSPWGDWESTLASPVASRPV